MSTFRKAIREKRPLRLAAATLCVTGLLGDGFARSPSLFPEGFENTARKISDGDGLYDRVIDCERLRSASVQWAAETDPEKRRNAKTLLQDILQRFYMSDWTGIRRLENFAGIESSELALRMMEILAGDDLKRTELREKARSQRIALRTASPLGLELDTAPALFGRSNDGCVLFFNGRSRSSSVRLPLAITPIGAGKFQIFTSGINNDSENGLSGFLFYRDGKELAHFTEEDALVGCFDAQDRALLVCAAEQPSQCSLQLR